MNVYRAHIPANQPDGKLSVYLRHAFSLLPEHALRDALKNRDVKMNGVRCGEGSMLMRDAELLLYTRYEAALPVVFEDENVLVIDKPANISCDEDDRGGQTVLNVLTDRAKGQYTPRLCHRLDNQTSGLLILAKNDLSEQCLLEAFSNREIDKRYVCLVRGIMRPEEAVREAFLVKDPKLGRVRVVTHDTPEAKPIKTGYRLIGQEDCLSRVEVRLFTGRTHQIRAHMAFLGHPVLGDDVYGDRSLNKRMKTTALKLCSASLTLHTTGILSYLNDRKFEARVPF